MQFEKRPSLCGRFSPRHLRIRRRRNVYGAIDTGLTYKHIAESGGDSLEMTSGNYAGRALASRAPKTGDGLSVGFILENGFSSDSGALGKDGSIFNRESQIYLKTRFGTFGAAASAPSHRALRL